MRHQSLLLLLCLSLCLSWTMPLHANEGAAAYHPDDYPTLAAAAQALLPPADRYDIARRLQGIAAIPALPSRAPTRQVGERQRFFVSNTQTNQVVEVEAVLRAAGEHVLVWVDAASDVTDQAAQGFANRFDTTVYQPVRALWGSEDTPGIDGEARVHVLFTVATSPGVAGYFAGQNTYPRAIVPISNEHEMMIFNSRAFQRMDDDEALSIAAHEFQHMIRRTVDQQEAAWLDEGFSMLTEHVLGYTDNHWALNEFAQRPHTQLNRWGIADQRSAEYGAGLFFLLYLHDRFGMAVVQAISAHPADGLDAVDATLRERENRAVDDVFADWVLANLLRCAECGYGYRTLPPDVFTPTLRGVAPQLPATFAGRSAPYGTQYFSVSDMPDTVAIDLDMPRDIGLIPAAPTSGGHMWYALRGDDSNPRLTRAFDLRGIGSATLNYRLWYDLEAFWDYAYVSISADGGRTWQIQETAHTTRANPNGRSIGAGYNGASAGWQHDALVLDAYAGQEILVRFEVITDDATARAGLALDDVALLAAGYFSDFERDGGGWQAEGWIRTDNRLPLQAWVQAVQLTSAGLEVTRWQTHGGGTFLLDAVPDAQAMYLAVSPYAPLTSLPVAFTVTVRPR